MKKILIGLVLAYSSFAAAEQHLTLEDPLAKDPRQALSEIYEGLYSIDYRNLSLRDFATYKAALQALRDLTASPLCPSKVETKIIVHESSHSVENDYNGCSYLPDENIQNSKTAIEDEGMRECYRQGFIECSLVEPARIISLVTYGTGISAGCKITGDVVVKGQKK